MVLFCMDSIFTCTRYSKWHSETQLFLMPNILVSGNWYQIWYQLFFWFLKIGIKFGINRFFGFWKLVSNLASTVFLVSNLISTVFLYKFTTYLHFSIFRNDINFDTNCFFVSGNWYQWFWYQIFWFLEIGIKFGINCFFGFWKLVSNLVSTVFLVSGNWYQIWYQLQLQIWYQKPLCLTVQSGHLWNPFQGGGTWVAIPKNYTGKYRQKILWKILVYETNIPGNIGEKVATVTPKLRWEI